MILLKNIIILLWLSKLIECVKHDYDDGPYEVKVEEDFVFSTNHSNMTSATRYLIYDVSPRIGFNLRRDAYIRAATLIDFLNKRGEKWILVLPPWRHLIQWRSRYIEQEDIKWKEFFDLRNMNHYIPVMEFADFLKFEGYHGIDHILYLQPADEKSDQEIIKFEKCKERIQYYLDIKQQFRGYFWNIEGVYAHKHDCVSVKGRTTIIADFLKRIKARSVLIERFDCLLHSHYASRTYLRARRSLVFARHLREGADAFRRKYLNSNDEDDHTHYEEDWRIQIPLEGHARGGPYLGVHMRRGDFVFVHKEITPSIAKIGKEIAKILMKYKISTVYVATDGSDKEIQELQSYFDATVHRFPHTNSMLQKYRDGGIAIIEQWIVAHARYFIGTCHSTFSLRIQEERDILGFDEDTTYNCVCSDQAPKEKCSQPTRIKMRFK